LEVQLQAEKAEVSQRIKGGIARMQFLKEDESALIQVGPDILVVNQLRPYPEWPVIKDLIFEMLAIYRGIANPTGFARIGLRYINRIKIESPASPLSKYFRFYPTIPEPVPQDIRALLMRTEIPFEQSKGLLILTLGSVPESQPDMRSFVLDLDFITTDAESLTYATAQDWVEEAHTQIEVVFEASIADETRALFGEVST
jgi:uncharacterized protein (TIGR04255 family)